VVEVRRQVVGGLARHDTGRRQAAGGLCAGSLRWRLFHQPSARRRDEQQSLDRRQLRWRAAATRAWRAGAATGTASILLEKRQVGARPADPRRRSAWLLGIARLSQLW